ncbi:hypothetical protein DP939_42090 [Spongiactinospora rosea]|uniref:H repeat-associated protein N-terminal domain-containing protein n=1 Tax=Spongiactinospora rosea TaxID=2248750 RepID=A0A366LKY9_9ACTN|nr:hypothetical protein DP939_42090 [Spongiactinospora rosea]
MSIGYLRQSIKNRGRVRVPSSPIDVLARHLEHVTPADPPTDLPDMPTLAEILDTIPDPRSRRGRRYRLGPLPALSLLAVLGGATSLTKITRFIAGYDLGLRAQAGLPGTTGRIHPGTLLARLDGDAFDTATCTYLASIAAGPLPPPHRTGPGTEPNSPAWPWTARPCAAAAPPTAPSTCCPPPATTPRPSWPNGRSRPPATRSPRSYPC